MDLIIHSLKSIAVAIIEPMHLVMLVVFGIIFYFKNVRIVSIQKMTLGEGINSPLELTLSQIVLGILAGAIGSVVFVGIMTSVASNSTAIDSNLAQLEGMSASFVGMAIASAVFLIIGILGVKDAEFDDEYAQEDESEVVI